MTKTFRQALLEACETNNVKLSRVSAETGVSYEQLKKVRQREGASTNVDDAVRVAHYFGVSLDEFLDDQTAQDRVEIVAQYNRLSREERELIQAISKGRSVPDLPDAS